MKQRYYLLNNQLSCGTPRAVQIDAAEPHRSLAEITSHPVVDFFREMKGIQRLKTRLVYYSLLTKNDALF